MIGRCSPAREDSVFCFIVMFCAFMERECLTKSSQGAASLAIGLVLPRTHTPRVRFPTENPGKTPLVKTVRRTVDVRRTSEPPAERAAHRRFHPLRWYDSMSAGHLGACLWNPPALWKKGWTPNLLSLSRVDLRNNFFRFLCVYGGLRIPFPANSSCIKNPVLPILEGMGFFM